MRIDNVRIEWVEDGFDDEGELMYGCTAIAEVSYDTGDGPGTRRLETLSSGGLYGVTFSGPDDPHKQEVEREQLEDLHKHLAAFNVRHTDPRVDFVTKWAPKR